MVWLLNYSEGSAIASTASAEQVTIFAYFPGLTGSVTEKGFDGWILIDEFQWGAGLGIGWSGNDDDNVEEEQVDEDDLSRAGEITEPSISEITLSKSAGPESAMLLFNMVAKKPYDKISIRFVRKAAGSTSYIPYQGYDTYNTLASGLSNSASTRSNGNETVSQSLSLNFMAIEYLMFDAQGEPTAAVRHHVGTGTSTLMEGANLDVVEVIEKQKKVKEIEETDTAVAEVTETNVIDNSKEQ